MNIEVRCEQCGDYMETEKEWGDRNVIFITVNPCEELSKAQAESDRRLALLKEMVEALESVCFYGDEEPYDYEAYHKARSELTTDFPTKYPIHPPFEGNQPAKILDIDKLIEKELGDE